MFEFLDVGIKRRAGNKVEWKYTTLTAEDKDTLAKMIVKLISDDTIVKLTIVKE